MLAVLAPGLPEERMRRADLVRGAGEMFRSDHLLAHDALFGTLFTIGSLPVIDRHHTYMFTLPRSDEGAPSNSKYLYYHINVIRDVSKYSRSPALG